MHSKTKLRTVLLRMQCGCKMVNSGIKNSLISIFQSNKNFIGNFSTVTQSCLHGEKIHNSTCEEIAIWVKLALIDFCHNSKIRSPFGWSKLRACESSANIDKALLLMRRYVDSIDLQWKYQYYWHHRYLSMASALINNIDI